LIKGVVLASSLAHWHDVRGVSVNLCADWLLRTHLPSRGAPYFIVPWPISVNIFCVKS